MLFNMLQMICILYPQWQRFFLKEFYSIARNVPEIHFEINFIPLY